MFHDLDVVSKPFRATGVFHNTVNESLHNGYESKL